MRRRRSYDGRECARRPLLPPSVARRRVKTTAAATATDVYGRSVGHRFVVDTRLANLSGYAVRVGGDLSPGTTTSPRASSSLWLHTARARAHTDTKHTHTLTLNLAAGPGTICSRADNQARTLEKEKLLLLFLLCNLCNKKCNRKLSYPYLYV